MLVENCPPDRQQDLDYVISLMDWEKNVDPEYRRHFFRPPVICTQDDAHCEKWVAYGNPYIAAKELTVYPGAEAVIRDDTPYGCILTQGQGTINGLQAETACMLRYGQASADEFFVSYDAAAKGVVVKNTSLCEPLVMLKHFPWHPGVPAAEAGE